MGFDPRKSRVLRLSSVKFTKRISFHKSIYLYNKEKTYFFVRPSVCLSTFLILSYFSKSIIVTQKIIIELRLKNSKEGNWKGKNVDKIKELFLNEEIHFFPFSFGGCHGNQAKEMVESGSSCS